MYHLVVSGVCIPTYILTAGLGNPEHPGRIRGISSKEGWKEGFGPEWEGEYKKRDRYKEEMESYFKEEAKKYFQEMMSKILSDPPPELMQRLHRWFTK
jgi:hypothetical protein